MDGRGAGVLVSTIDLLCNANRSNGGRGIGGKAAAAGVSGGGCGCKVRHKFIWWIISQLNANEWATYEVFNVRYLCHPRTNTQLKRFARQVLPDGRLVT